MREWEETYYINRTLCDVLSDMRLCLTSRNFGPLESLIEEVQIKGNRMEAALTEKKDLNKMHTEWAELRKKVITLRKEVKEKEKKIKKKEK